MKKSQNVGTKSAFTPVEYYYDPFYLFFIIKNLRTIYSSTFSGLTTTVVIFFFFFKKKTTVVIYNPLSMRSCACSKALLLFG